jgi:hypothetical protein
MTSLRSPWAALLLATASLQAADLPFVQARAVRLFNKDAARWKAEFERADPAKVSTYEGWLKRLAPHIKNLASAPADHPEVKQVQELYARFEAKVAAARGGGGGAAAGGASPAELAQTLNTEFKAIFNTVRPMKKGDYQDAAKVAKIRADLQSIRDRVQAAGGSGVGQLGTVLKNVDNLSKSFETNAKNFGAAAGGSAVPAADVRSLAANVNSALRQATMKLGRLRAQDYKDPAKVQPHVDALTGLKAKLEAAGGAGHPQLKPLVDNIDLNLKTIRENQAKVGAAVAANAAAAAEAKTAAAAAAAAKAASPAKVELNFQNKRNLQFLTKDLDRYARTLEGDLDVEKKPDYERMLANLENRWSALDAGVHGHPEVAAARARVDGLKKRVADALGNQQPLTDAEKQAIGEFRKVYNRLSYDLKLKLDPIELQVPAKRAEARALLEEMQAPLAKVANKEHETYQAEFAKIGPWIAKLEAAEKQSSAMAEEAGDVDGQLALIQQQFPQGSFSPVISKDADPERIEELGKTFQGWLKGVEAAQAFFEKARKLSVKARSTEFQNYAGWFRREVPGDIKRTIEAQLRNWDFHIDKAMLNSETTAEKQKKAVNPGAAMAEWIGNGLGAFERKLAWQRGFDGAEDPETRKKFDTLREREKKFQSVMRKFLEDTRMPEPSTQGDPELVAIAKKLMDEKGFQYRRLRQQNDKHTKREVHFTNGAWHVEDYDQFQVQYAMPKDGEWWVAYRAVRFFRSSYRSSVTGKWRLGGGFQPRRILEENIDK